MDINNDTRLVIKLGEEDQKSFPLGIGITIPEGYYLVLVQNRAVFPPITEEEEITLDEEYFEELEINYEDETVTCEIYLIKYQIEISHRFEDCHASLNKGYPLTFSFEIENVLFAFSDPNAILSNLYAFNEETGEGIYFNESNLIGLIHLTLLNEIEETLMLQSFFDVETGSIVYDSLSKEHQDYMDYMSALEVKINNLFEELGIITSIEINNFESVLPVEDFYISEA